MSITGPKPRPVMERLMDKVVIPTEPGCWEWTGGKDRHGYGRTNVGLFSAGTLHSALVHRVVWEALIGPIPPGLSLDHLCRNTSCVNPKHLEVVTHRENVLRGIGPTAINARKTQCEKCGGPFTLTSQNQRGCYPCALQRGREYDDKRKDKRRESYLLRKANQGGAQ